MTTVNGCKHVSIMSPQDEQWRRTSLLCLYTAIVLLSTTVCSQNINKQIVNIEDETLTDYSFLIRYHYTKSKDDIEFVTEFPCLLEHPVDQIVLMQIVWFRLFISRNISDDWLKGAIMNQTCIMEITQLQSLKCEESNFFFFS